jgi:hypothetical protein
MKKIAIFFAILFCLIFLVSEFFQRSTTPIVNPRSEISASPEDVKKHAVERAYKVSFDKGYSAFLRQIGFESKTSYQYTSNVQEVPVEEEILSSQEYQDALDKGYVDGYHKATEVTHCPRHD